MKVHWVKVVILSLVCLTLEQPAATKQDLRLTGTVDSVRLVKTEDMTVRGQPVRFYWIQLDLSLLFTNIGSDRLIVPKTGFAVPYHKIAPDLPSLAATRYNHELIDGIRLFSAGQIPANPPSNLYTILGPARSWKMKTELETPLKQLTPGEYYLQLVAESSWISSEQEFKELSKRWRKSGRLWWTTVTSQPIRFVLPALQTPRPVTQTKIE